MSNEETTTPRSRALDATLLLAGLTLGGWLSAHLYERGYLSFFEAGRFSRIDVESLVVGGLSLLVVIGVYGLTAIVVFFVVKYDPNARLVILLGAAAAWGAVMVVLDLIGETPWWDTTLHVAITIAYVTTATVLQRAKRRGKLDSEDLAIPRRYSGAMDALRSLLGENATKVMLLIGLVMAAGEFARCVGRSRAQQQTYFMVFNHHGDNYVILRVYGDALIAARLDRSTRLVGPQYTLFGADSSVTMTNERLGPLAAAPPLGGKR